MSLLILGLLLFLGTHLVTSLRPVRARLVERLGDTGYKLGYSALSLLGLVLLAQGYGLYRAEAWVPLWEPPRFARHLAWALMVPAFVLLIAPYLPGRIKAATKHPQLLAVKIWAFAHLLANGDLGSALLFGGFLAWAVVARISAKRRADASHGEPGGGLDLDGRPAPAPSGVAALPSRPLNDAIAVGLGLALYAWFLLWGHPWLIGVPALG